MAKGLATEGRSGTILMGVASLIMLDYLAHNITWSLGIMRWRLASKEAVMVDQCNPSHGAGMQISFALYAAAGRMARMHKPFLDPLGLTFPQYLVMLELYRERPRTVGDLGNTLGMDTGTITPLLKRLAVSGTVTRTRDVSDERRVLVDLTPAGESIRDEVLNVASKIKSACQLTEDDLVSLRNTLHGLAHPAKAQDQQDVPS